MCCGSLGQKMLMSPENLSRVRTKFWDMKMLWHRERRYVTIPNMEVWLRLARLAPDVPDGWSFADAVDSEPGESYHLFWEGINIISPIPLHDFFDYILLPEMATLLIAQDLHVSKAEAYGIWARSKDYGNAFYGNVDDGTINDINNKNIKAQVNFSRCPFGSVNVTACGTRKLTVLEAVNLNCL